MTTELTPVETTEAKPKKRATKRRGYGEGSIFQRADGRWCATVVVGRDERGKRIRRTVYGKDKKEAQTRLIEMQGQRQSGTLRSTARQTVAEYLNHWLAVMQEKYRPNTHAGYADAVAWWINPHIGGVQLSALSGAHVEMMLVRLRDSGAPTRSIRRAFESLRTALNRAVKTRAISRNPCGDVECARAPRKEIEPYTLDEARRLLTASKATRYHALFVLAIDAGLRQGELFGLKWEDIDFDGRALTVKRSLGEARGKQYFCEPKSKTSRRRLSLSTMAVDALRDHRKQGMAEGQAGAETVFYRPHGALLLKTDFRRRVWLPLVEAAGVPFKRFHDLRHTNISLMLDNGENMMTVKARAGHAQIATTMNIYGHLMESTDRVAADRLGDMLNSATEVKTA